jgi:hypothetical protein
MTEAVRKFPFSHLLRGAVDCHVHCAPHINPRTATVFEAVRDAAGVGLAGLGIMDVFANSSGLAALAMRELGHLGVDVFGGIILEPYVGGIDPRVVRNALAMGYGPGTGALKEILDLVAAASVVFNTGHVSGAEAVRLVEEARSRGVEKILCPASYFSIDEARAAVAAGAVIEFSFFVLSHATAVGQTMIDAERHRFPPVTLESVVEKIAAVGPASCVLSSDSGSYVLPPPVEAFREMIIMIQSGGFDDDAIRVMTATNPTRLFIGRCGTAAARA